MVWELASPLPQKKNALVDTLGRESFPTSLSLRLATQGPSEVLLDNFWERFSNGLTVKKNPFGPQKAHNDQDLGQKLKLELNEAQEMKFSLLYAKTLK